MDYAMAHNLCFAKGEIKDSYTGDWTACRFACDLSDSEHRIIVVSSTGFCHSHLSANNNTEALAQLTADSHFRDVQPILGMGF